MAAIRTFLMNLGIKSLVSVILLFATLFATGFAMKSAKEKEIKIVSQGNEEPWVNSEITTSEKELVQRYLNPTPEEKVISSNNSPNIQCCSPKWTMEKVEEKHALNIQGSRYSRGDILPDGLYKKAKELPEGMAKDMPQSPEGTKFVILENKLVRISSYSHTILDISELPLPKT
jgi:hypothetical protein